MNKVVYIKNGLVKYEDYKEILNELEDKVKECKLKDKEIERLNKELQQEKKDFKEVNDYAFKLNNIIYLIKNSIDVTIQIIKEQPTGNDEWILERLNGIKNIGGELKKDK